MQAPSIRLDWVDAFVDKIRPYVHVRLTDNVLIRLPNHAFKLNNTGAQVLHHIFHGGSIEDILKARSFDHDLPAQLYSFFTDLTQMLSSSVCDAYHSPSLQRVPFDLGYIELPVLSEIALTWRCNIKCRFCYASCTCISEPDDGNGKEELSTGDVKRVLEMIRRDAEVPSVSFTGGEPMLRDDIIDLIAYASGSLNMRVNLITNGTLITQRTAKELRAAGLASAQVSIESPNPEVHDHIVGFKNSFRASLNGLLALKNEGILVHPHATLCRLNMQSLEEMARFAKSLGIERFSLNMIIPAGRGTAPDLTLKYSEIKNIVLKIKSASEAEGVRFMWYSPTPMCLFNPVAHQMGNKGCSACEGLLSIDPFGRLLPCSSWKEPVGNLLQEGFQALWFGDRARFLREKGAAHPGCRDCEHFAVCHGACPLYFKVHGYDELEEPLAQLKSNRSSNQRSIQ
jgi:radical SAM protein with 4Fe4S-binding SPASM domain